MRAAVKSRLVAASRTPQSRAARRGHPAGRARADPRRRGQRQDPRADHAHRLAGERRPRRPRRHPCRDLHQQGGARDADAHRGDAAGEPARHVGRHLPRPVQSHAARTPPRRGPAAGFPDPRLAGPARRDQAPVQEPQRRRGPLCAARPAVLHQRAEGGGRARARRRRDRRPCAPPHRALRRL